MPSLPIAAASRRPIPHGVLGPWLMGLAWRLIAAASGWGWFAIDDYLFVIEKGALWQSDPQAPFGCDYRSTLVPRIMTGLLGLGHACMGPDPAYALQVAYAVLGVVSTLSIIAVYHIARLGAGSRAAHTSAWLAACYVIMPRICTRALLESIAMWPIALSVWALLESTTAHPNPRARRHLQAGLSAALCGLGAMVRFQVGVLVLPMGLWAWRKGGMTRLASFALGGLVATAVQAGLDSAEGRIPLSTPWAYVQYNLHHASQYGTSPIYTYALQCLMLALPPACILLGPSAWRRALKTNMLVSVLCMWFVGTHSFIAHKEDRFLFPILPLLLVLLGTALTPLLSGEQPQDSWPQKYALWGRRMFWTLNTLGLVVCSFSDAQRNWTVPLLRIARETPAGQTRSLVVIEPDVVPSYYLNGRASWQGYPNVAAFYADALQSGRQVDYVLLRAMPDDEGQAMLLRLGCAQPERFYGDAVDRLLVRVNRHNLRRAATTLLRCTKELAR